MGAERHQYDTAALQAARQSAKSEWRNPKGTRPEGTYFEIQASFGFRISRFELEVPLPYY